MTKISAKTISGTVRQNSMKRLTAKRSQARRCGIFRGKKIERKPKHGAGQRADIADQDGLAQHPEPFAPAPEPLADVGPDPAAILQRENAIEVAGEVSKIREERPQIHLRPDRGDDEGCEEHRRRQRKAQALSRDRLAIGLVERGELLARQNWNGDGHCDQHRVGPAEEEPGRADPALML